MATNNVTNNYGTAATAYVNFNGSSAAIRKQFNVSMVTRNSTGKYQVTFSTSYTTINFSPLLTISDTNLPNTLASPFIDSLTAAPTTTTLNITSSGTAFYDEDYFTVVILGI